MTKDFVRASQLVKTPTKWRMKNSKKVGPPDPDFSKAIRQLVIEAVYGRYSTKAKPSTLISIFTQVQDKIQTLKTIGQWPWKIPGKRTIDRRVNEASDPRFYEDGVPKIVMVTEGVYEPNPEMFKISDTIETTLKGKV